MARLVKDDDDWDLDQGDLLLIKPNQEVVVKFLSGIYKTEQGETDLLGRVSPFDTYQAQVLLEDRNEEKVLAIGHFSLRKGIRDELKKYGMTGEDLENKQPRFRIKRGEKYEYEVEFLRDLDETSIITDIEDNIILELIRQDVQDMVQVSEVLVNKYKNEGIKMSGVEMRQKIDKILENSKYITREGPNLKLKLMFVPPRNFDLIKENVRTIMKQNKTMSKDALITMVTNSFNLTRSQVLYIISNIENLIMLPDQIIYNGD